MEPTGHQLAMALRVAYLTMHRRTDALMTPLGVTADQFVVLAALAEADSLSQRELTDRVASDPNTVRAMIVLLQRRGFIEREPDPDDKRAWRVSLTPAGRRAFQKLWRRTESLRNQLRSRMSASDVATLVRLLDLLAESVSSTTAGRRLPRSVSVAE